MQSLLTKSLKMATIEGAQLEKDDDYVKLKQISKRKSPSWTAWIYTNFFIPKVISSPKDLLRF